MLIKVKNLAGNLIELNVDEDNAVGDVKLSVQQKTGIPPGQQRLIFGGKNMADEKTLKTYQVQQGAILHLVLALRGGRAN